MTDLTLLPKTELNVMLAAPLNASALKKIGKPDLIRMILAEEAANAPKPVKESKAKAAKDAPKASRKPGADVILFLPAESQKAPKAGSKRATIIDLLRAPTGATVEDIAAATGWSRSVAQSALYVDVKGLGHGVERKDGRLHLLPEGAK